MLYINDGVIAITKGDDAVLEITINKSDGTAFEMNETDTLTLTVRECPCANYPVLLTATTAPGSNRIVLTGSATANICPGQYSYDVQLNRVGGERYTVLPDDLSPGVMTSGSNYKNFLILSEVTVP